MGKTQIRGSIGNYITIPKVVMAVQWTGDNINTVEQLFEKDIRGVDLAEDKTLQIIWFNGETQKTLIPLNHWVVWLLFEEGSSYSVYSPAAFGDLYRFLEPLRVDRS